MSEWAQKEIELAIESEKKASEGTNEWEYGVACYESAMKAYKALLADNHSGMSIQITKNILNRLIDGKCLTPIEDTPDVWNEITESADGSKKYQCKRMSSLFKKVATDGTVTYSDIDRVSCAIIPDAPITTDLQLVLSNRSSRSKCRTAPHLNRSKYLQKIFCLVMVIRAIMTL